MTDDQRPTTMVSLPELSSATIYCYDPLFLEHNLPGHPENRARLERIMRTLADEGLLARMTRVPPKPVDLTLLGRVHQQPYIAALKRLAERGGAT